MYRDRTGKGPAGAHQENRASGGDRGGGYLAGRRTGPFRGRAGTDGGNRDVITPDKSLKIDSYTMSGELFGKGFPRGGGPCSCSSVCCEGGVYVDLHEREV